MITMLKRKGEDAPLMLLMLGNAMCSVRPQKGPSCRVYARQTNCTLARLIRHDSSSDFGGHP